MMANYLVKVHNPSICLENGAAAAGGEQIYFILDESNKAVKIGITKNIYKRISDIQANSAVKLVCVKIIERSSKNDEAELHLKFKDYHIQGEWFRIEGELEKYLSESIRDTAFHIRTNLKNNTIIKAAKTAEERNELLALAGKLEELKKTELSMKRAAAGYLGGIATFRKKGREGMSESGKLGGRPRLMALEEITNQTGSQIIKESPKETERGKGCLARNALPPVVMRALGLK